MSKKGMASLVHVQGNNYPPLTFSSSLSRISIYFIS